MPTTQVPVLRPTPTLSGMRAALLLRLFLARLVQRIAALQHVERGLAGVDLVLVVVERRVPERHDGVAHIFVDGALAIEDRVGKRRQEAVHQRGQALRIVLVGLRDRGEAAHVGEHDRHLALLAAEHELFRRLRELLDQRRRDDIGRRCRGSARAALLAHEAREDQRQIDRRGREQRIGEVDE